MNSVEVFMRLFRGRGDAYGSWQGPRAVREPLTPEMFARHLASTEEADWIGVYNVIGDRCSWGCVDIDTKDLSLAHNVQLALWRKDIPGWVEATTRGYHVWVFPDEPLVQAATMRRALTAACLAVGYSPKEVFPKQTKVTGAGLGNWVRLPYNGWEGSGEHSPRMFLEHMEAVIPLWEFLARIDNDRARTSALEAVASLLPASRLVDVSVDYATGLEVEPYMRQLGGTPYRLWRDGPRHGHDRSSTLAHLAYCLAEAGTTASEALTIVTSADERWGKGYLHRGEPGEVILHKLIETAYGRTS